MNKLDFKRLHTVKVNWESEVDLVSKSLTLDSGVNLYQLQHWKRKVKQERYSIECNLKILKFNTFPLGFWVHPFERNKMEHNITTLGNISLEKDNIQVMASSYLIFQIGECLTFNFTLTWGKFCKGRTTKFRINRPVKSIVADLLNGVGARHFIDMFVPNLCLILSLSYL